MSFLEAFRGQTEANPARLALQDGSLSFSYGTLDAATDAVAHLLEGTAVQPGTVIGYMGCTGAARTIAYLGSWKAGTTFVWLDPDLPLAALRDIATNAQPEVILTDRVSMQATAEALGAKPLLLPEVWPTRRDVPVFEATTDIGHLPAHILYTSGSTGKPKGAVLGRDGEDHAYAVFQDRCGVVSSDRTALFPHFWPCNYTMPLMTGASMHHFDFGRHGPAAALAWMEGQGITQAFTFPAIFRAMADVPGGKFPASFRRLILSGEPLLRRDLGQFDRMSPPGSELVNSYGSTELNALTFSRHEQGAPVPFDTMPLGARFETGTAHVVDDSGASVPPGVVGEIVSTSRSNFKGYRNDPERSARTLKSFAGSQAYFTGDRGYMDAAGILHPAGRADDQIKIRGYTVRASDIEQEILSIPGIHKAAVVSIESPHAIRQLVCHYEPLEQPGPSAEDLRRHLSSRAPAFMVPSYFVAHAALPVTHSGKIIRRHLPNPLDRPDRDAHRNATFANAAECRLARIWQDVLGHAEFCRNDDFFDAGGDSLQAMAMLVSADKEFDQRIPLESLILEGASIATLAAKFRPDHGEKPAHALAALNRGGTGTPIFALHVTGGHLSDYLELGHSMDSFRPILGVRPQGLDRHVHPDGTMTQIARHAAATISASAHQAPHHLIGFSAGGAFALETARQLLAEGSAPPRLVLLDANCVWLDRLRWLRPAWRALKAGDLGLGGKRLIESVPVGTGKTHAVRNLDEPHLRALLNHRPEPLRLPRSLLVLGADGLITGEEVAEWQRLLGPGLDILRVPGDHMSMIRGTHAAALAQQLEGWLRAE